MERQVDVPAYFFLSGTKMRTAKKNKMEMHKSDPKNYSQLRNKNVSQEKGEMSKTTKSRWMGKRQWEWEWEWESGDRDSPWIPTDRESRSLPHPTKQTD